MIAFICLNLLIGSPEKVKAPPLIYLVGTSSAIAHLPNGMKNAVELAETERWRKYELGDQIVVYFDENSTGLLNLRGIKDYIELGKSVNDNTGMRDRLLARILLSHFPTIAQQADTGATDIPVQTSERIMLQFSKGEDHRITSSSSILNPPVRSKIALSNFTSNPVAPYNSTPTNLAALGFGEDLETRNLHLPEVMSFSCNLITQADSSLREAFDKTRSQAILSDLNQFTNLSRSGLTYSELKESGVPFNNLTGCDDFILDKTVPILSFAVKIGDRWLEVGINAEGVRK